MKHLDKTNKTETGNAFVYILLAVVLLAALTLVLSRSQEGDSSMDELTEAKIELYANNIIQYAAAAQRAVDQMTISGTVIDNIDFILPSDAAFETGSDINKLYHPDGGGLVYKPMPSNYQDEIASAPSAGFYIGRFNNVEWTETSADDVIFTAWEINDQVCAKINKLITGSSTIPTVTSADPSSQFVDTTFGGAANADFTTTECAACESYPTLCIQSGSVKAYYQILASQ